MRDWIQIIILIAIFGCVAAGTIEIKQKCRWQVLIFLLGIMMILQPIVVSGGVIQ